MTPPTMLSSPISRDIAILLLRYPIQKNSRRLWRSQRRKSRSVPEGEADFPAAIFLAGKCPNLGRDPGNRKWCRQTGSRQSTPLSTIRTRYGNSVSTPDATRTGKTQQISLQKGSRYGISVSTPHRRYGRDCGRHFCGRHFRDS